MIRIGIVGVSKKSIPDSCEDLLYINIRDLILKFDPTSVEVISGQSPDDGVDKYVESIAYAHGYKFKPFPADNLHHHWDGKSNHCPDPAHCYGYMARNWDIANYVNRLFCFSVVNPHLRQCYHCQRYTGHVQNHVVNGGCWTMWKAREMQKPGYLIIYNPAI